MQFADALHNAADLEEALGSKVLAAHDRALAEDPHLMNGLNIAGGHIVLKVVADALDMPYTPYQPAA